VTAGRTPLFCGDTVLAGRTERVEHSSSRETSGPRAAGLWVPKLRTRPVTCPFVCGRWPGMIR